MNRAIAWFASNRVAANLLMALFVVGGVTAILRVPQKTFPDIDIEVVTVQVEYRGAAPEEVEEGVCIRVEEAIDGVEGIDRITSTSAEGICVVAAELLFGAEMSEVLDEIKNRVDGIDTFPEEAEKPVIEQVSLRRGVADIAISGPADERTLKALGERVRDEVLALPSVTQAELALVRPVEISIEVPEETLRRHELSFDEVARAVGRSSVDLPGGSIKSDGGEILLRTKGQAYRGDEFGRIVVLTRADGTRVALSDVATVVDGFEDVDLAARFDGQPAALVQVYRVGDQDVIEITDELRTYVAEAERGLPDGVSLTFWMDDSKPLRGRIDTLLRNARSGFLLVLVVLALFLRARVAFWVTLGVPIAFLGALWTFPMLGLSINVMSTFAFIVVLGILVDDAVVVGENVYTYQSRPGSDRLSGAIRGTQEVSVPVVFGVLTTVATFVPLLLVPGPMGQMFTVLALVVIACLIFSLIESQLVLPAHLAHGHERAESAPRWAWQARWKRVQRAFGSSLERFSNGAYARWLGTALEWRYATIATAVALLLLAVAVIASGRLRFSFFPPIETDYVAAWLTMPQGTPVEATAEAAAAIESSVDRLRAELDPEYAPGGSLVLHVLSSVGAQPFRTRQQQTPADLGSARAGGGHVAEVVIELIPSEQRDIKTSEVANHWRRIVGDVPGAVELVFASDMFSAGAPIDIQLQGNDTDALRSVARLLKQELAAYPGVIDIADSFREGKREVKLRIDPSAELLGLTMSDLARQVRQAFYGEEVQRIQRGRDDVRVMVRYPRSQRRSLGDLENLRIRTATGTEVPFGTVASADVGRGFATIQRADRMRVVNVTAKIDRNRTTENEVLADLQREKLPAILADHPSVSYSLQGIQREQRRAFSGLLAAFAVALLAIYALLAIPLRSYAQPLVIMSVIPFGLVGAIGGHMLMQAFGQIQGLSFMSVTGIVALAGVVVNASLVLVHRANDLRAEGGSVFEAATGAARTRFRPIVLTSLTTFAGLTPLMLERSVQAQFLIPMAVSLAYGVLFATFITLFVVPCGYVVLDDLRALRPSALLASFRGSPRAQSRT